MEILSSSSRRYAHAKPPLTHKEKDKNSLPKKPLLDKATKQELKRMKLCSHVRSCESQVVDAYERERSTTLRQYLPVSRRMKHLSCRRKSKLKKKNPCSKNCRQYKGEVPFMHWPIHQGVVYFRFVLHSKGNKSQSCLTMGTHSTSSARQSSMGGVLIQRSMRGSKSRWQEKIQYHVLIWFCNQCHYGKLHNDK